jgi:putative SOS response-associated peptidase YedK
VPFATMRQHALPHPVRCRIPSAMCGRFTHLYTWTELEALMRITTDLSVPLLQRFNVAPTQEVPIVRRREDGSREAVLMRWGLIPSWAKEPSIASRTINARAETVASKPAFRSAYRRRRCLIPVSGFYEWETPAGGGAKRPWYIRVKDAPLFALAGLWEEWTPEDGDPMLTFTIVTTTANELVGQFHERMPVIVPPEKFERWLDVTQNVDDLLAPFPAERMEAYRVSTRVNRARTDDAACIRPLE